MEDICVVLRSDLSWEHFTLFCALEAFPIHAKRAVEMMFHLLLLFFIEVQSSRRVNVSMPSSTTVGPTRAILFAPVECP